MANDIQTKRLTERTVAICAIKILRDRGMSYEAVAKCMTEAHIVPLCGRPDGAWFPSSVWRMAKQ